MRRVLLFGAHGYLASLIRCVQADTCEFVCPTRCEVDFSNPDDVYRFVRAADFDICMNLAADISTESCDRDFDYARRVNCASAIEVARACAELGRRVVFFSTEQCFNAACGEAPYAEDDAMGTASRYGQMKMTADQWIQRHADDYLVLRLSWMFGAPRSGARMAPNIFTRVLKAVEDGCPAAFRVHERRCMTYAPLFAEQFARIASLPTGVYHVASENGLTTFESACLVAQKLGCGEDAVRRLIVPDVTTYAERPRDFRLDAGKLRVHGIDLGTFGENVARCVREFKRGR